MKNSIYIDVDTDRDPIITISKPSDQGMPSDAESEKTMILNDITCVSETISTLINMADKNGYGKKEDLVKAVVGRLQDMLV